MKDSGPKENIIRHYLNNLYTKDEVEQFFDNLKDRNNDPQMENIVWELLEESQAQNIPTPGTLLYEKYKQEARQLLEKIEKSRKRKVRRFFLYVASVASILLLSVLILYHLSFGNQSSNSFVEATTTYGEKKELMFSDCTKVAMNSRTQIVYSPIFGKKERRVSLTGEAFFNVSRSKTPFIVETPQFDIQVLGTAFNVKAYDGDETVSVTVERGRVRICMSEASLILGRNEKIILNTQTGEIIKETIKNNSSFAWMKGGLYFDRTPIRDVARELERIYGCRIVFNENEEFNNLISGEHDNMSLESVLQSIEYTSGIRYMKKDNEVLLYKHKL